jgi:hypothetical protein
MTKRTASEPILITDEIGKPIAVKFGKQTIPWSDLRPVPNRADRRRARREAHADRALLAKIRDKEMVPAPDRGFGETCFDILVVEGDVVTGVLRGTPRLERRGGGFVPRPSWKGPLHLDPRRRTPCRSA